ncbi:hypothetical protein BKA61DRAFT_604639 [Leptodontidium sp. MPI-SDFR-AT-0119]|nr:hypothetical protein BKA61DRAFT_604639 [Leptodontidium sp. MPI-SDFR-AT-0119]
MSNTPITSLPGYPYFYAIPINGFIRDGPDKKPKRSSKSRLHQDRHSLPQPPPQYTLAPTWSPYILEGLAELDGLNEIPRQIYPDHQRPYEKAQGQIIRPKTTPPETTLTRTMTQQRRKHRFPSLKTKYSWSTYKPQVSSPLSSSSSVDSFPDLCTIEEQDPDPNQKQKPGLGNTRNPHQVDVSEMEGSSRDGDGIGDEERVQLALIESIFLILHELQPTYLPQSEGVVSNVMARPSRKYRLLRQPSVRISPTFVV